MPEKATQTDAVEEEKAKEEEEKKEPTRRILAVVPRSRGFMPRPIFGAARLECPAVLFPTSSDDPILAPIPAYLRNPPTVRNAPRMFPFTPPPPQPTTLPSTPDSPPSLTSSPPLSPHAPPIFNLANESNDYAPVAWDRLPLPADLTQRLQSRLARDFDPAPAPLRSIYSQSRQMVESLRQDFLDTLSDRR